MGRFKLSEEQQAFIRENRLKMSGKKMANLFGCSDGVVYRYMEANGLKVSKGQSNIFKAMAQEGRTSFNADQDVFIQENYLTMPVKRLASEIDKSGTALKIRMRQLGLKIPKELAKQRAIDSRFQKGHKSHNTGKRQKDYMSPEAIAKTKATRFKKGSIPHNTKYNGHERISKDGYIEVRIKKGTYRLKHLHSWEQLNGALPDGHCLRCIDGDIKNCEPSNWELITRAENMKLNSIWQWPEELQQSIRLVNKINNHLKTKL